MKMSAEFKNGACRVMLIPDDEWEQKLLGAIAKGGNQLIADVMYKSEGHFTHEKAAVVQIMLNASGAVSERN